ncbi:Obtusifoliol 14-alpha demethylase [Tolypocladium capitatum]|uniref:Obtusifoliol 14-alpha demethylase n=1 Tax=Tolypocladium capitatum TaxID=45235 RepID=A0A2K3PSA4_9HYPO|nr:Obtusifoliol 14-alpha demethylase [Tolypocladium capitatum]
MTVVLSAFAAPQSWPAGTSALLFALAVLIVGLTSRRPAFPSNAPPLLKGWPITGSVGFFRARRDFLRAGRDKSPSGQFSFYYGPHPIVALSGPSARTTFYTARGLDLTSGYGPLIDMPLRFTTLLAVAPKVDGLFTGDLTGNFKLLMKGLLPKDCLAAKLHHITADTDDALRKISTLAVIEPFDVMIALVYRLTHRMVGSNDVADNPRLLAETLAVFGGLENSSAIEVMFPNLPTPGKLMRLWGAAKLYWALQRIMKDRRKTGRREPDPMQDMMDHGVDDVLVSAAIIGALFAGLANSGFNIAWILLFLSDDPYWYAEMRAEVDAVVSKHRLSEDETAADILPRLSLDEWETEFPLLELGLRDSIRIIMPGVSMRKNISGKDVQIGDTGQVIPKNAFAVYSLNDVHMDDQLYKNPTRWDPSRYLPGREEDKKAPHAHFAKLEVTTTMAMFLAYYDFTRCDRDGNDAAEPLPKLDPNAIIEKRPATKVFLKCSPRFQFVNGKGGNGNAVG